jgi:hypothetical protein
MTRSALFEEVMRPRMRIITVLWAALTISLFVYPIVAYQKLGTREPLPVDQAVLTAMYIAGAVLALVSLAVRLTAFSDDRIAAKMRIPVDPSRLGLDAKTGEVDKELREKLLGLSDKEQRASRLIVHFFAPFLLCMALNEAVVIIGMVLVFMFQQLDVMWPFVGVGIVLNLTQVRTLPSVIERAFKVV